MPLPFAWHVFTHFSFNAGPFFLTLSSFDVGQRFNVTRHRCSMICILCRQSSFVGFDVGITVSQPCLEVIIYGIAFTRYYDVSLSDVVLPCKIIPSLWGLVVGFPFMSPQKEGF